VKEARTWLLLVLLALVGIGILFSFRPMPEQFNRYLEFVKIVAIALFTTAVVTNRERLRVLVWIIALSLGFYGVKTGIFGIMTLGRDQVLQGPGGMLADNNDFSLAMAMAVPRLFQIGWTEKREPIRRAFWFALPLTVITIGLTHSRGGFLSVVAALGVLVWRSRNRLQGLAIGACVALAALALAPKDYLERLQTITEYETEGSARGRIKAWGIATRMALDHPILGVGFGKFRQHYNTYNENPTPGELRGSEIIVAHNSYLQIWAECGTPAILIYLTLILLSFATVWRVRALARRRYYSSWIINYATMFEASLTAFVIGAIFLNRAHFDLFYHWVALVLVFGRIAMQEMEQDRLHPERDGGRGELVHVPRRGFAWRPRLRGFGSPLSPQGT
jgi:probable O-glycosylation ligase (exosortase A-associated)